MSWKSLFAIILILVAAVCAVAFSTLEKGISKMDVQPDTDLRAVYLAGETLQVSVAATPEARTKGLSGRTGLAPDEGMLFVFDKDAKYQFWMKDMLFPIDILWLSDRGEVQDIREKVSPDTYPDVFVPNAPARYVLELPAGFVEAYSVKAGDIVRF